MKPVFVYDVTDGPDYFRRLFVSAPPDGETFEHGGRVWRIISERADAGARYIWVEGPPCATTAPTGN